MVLVLEGLFYVIKSKASDDENKLLLDIWNSIKTRVYYTAKTSKEGVTFHNLAMFLHVLNNIYPEEHM